MSRADLALTLDWAASEGWNPGLHDAELFHAADPHGFLMARLDGIPAAAISVVKYDLRFSFLGLYIAAPEFRGHGIGWALWQAGMTSAGNRTVGLDGVLAQQANYARSGFSLVHRNIRFQGPAPARAPTADVQTVDAARLPLLLDFDLAHFRAQRSAFIQPWLFHPAHHALAVIRDGHCQGYGVLRPCRDGYKIGPLFAEDAEIAETLFLSLASRAEGTTIALDCPEPNEAAIRLAMRHGLTHVFETARMYRGQAPELPLGQIFGITTFELG